MSEVCRDSYIGKQDTSPRALHYLTNTYRCIARNLQNGAPSNSTTAAVMSMALHEDFRGQPKRSKVHIDALEQLVKLRGGVEAFEAVGLLHKICRSVYEDTLPKLFLSLAKSRSRADIEFALHNGSCPRFYRDAFPRQTIQKMLIFSTTTMNGSFYEAQTRHHDIAGVVTDMISVSIIFNDNYTCCRLDPDAYQEILISVCYRLLHACPFGVYELETIQESALSLGLLAFMTTMLFQHGRSQRLPYELLASLLRNLLLDEKNASSIEGKTSLWLLFVGGISVLGVEDRDWLIPRIKASLRALHLSSWKDALDEIKQFPWISVIHDQPGKQIWKAVVWE
jgi:hypothetical protein